MDKKIKLKVELIPSKAWGRNVRAIVSGEVWGRLREKFGTPYDKWKTWPEPAPPLICNICNQPFFASLHLHEIWEFDDSQLTQKLKGFTAICENCHDVVHLGRAMKVGLGEKAMAHLAAVNKWTSTKTAKHVQEAISQWERRKDIPRYSIPERTTEFHGITNQAVKTAPKFSQEYPKILQILSGKIVVTYNARFDQKVIENTCKIHKVESPDDVIWECAMRVYKAYQEPQAQFSKLPGGKHSALEDCKAALKLVKMMAKNEEIPRD